MLLGPPHPPREKADELNLMDVWSLMGRTALLFRPQKGPC